MLFKGLGVAMVTPFDDFGINYAAAKTLVEHLIGGGADAIIALGTTGEGSTVTAEERRDFIKFVVECTAKRVPVIVGTGSNSTMVAIENTVAAQRLNADGVLVVTPYYNKCTQNGLVAHYGAICAATDLPVIAYNVPSRTGVNILPETALRLSKINGLDAIKEASGNMEQVMRTIALCGEDFAVYSGDDALNMPIMCMGGAGVISVAAALAPRMFKDMLSYIDAGDYAKARKLSLNTLPLVGTLFSEVNPIPVKAALRLIGIDCGHPRLPLESALPDTLERLKRELSLLNLTAEAL